MKLLSWLLYALSLYAVIIGLWDHSWQLILAGVATAVIYPLISTDAEDMAPDKEKGNP